jgi:hypothetical protein
LGVAYRFCGGWDNSIFNATRIITVSGGWRHHERWMACCRINEDQLGPRYLRQLGYGNTIYFRCYSQAGVVTLRNIYILSIAVGGFAPFR